MSPVFLSVPGSIYFLHNGLLSRYWLVSFNNWVKYFAGKIFGRSCWCWNGGFSPRICEQNFSEMNIDGLYDLNYFTGIRLCSLVVKLLCLCYIIASDGEFKLGDALFVLIVIWLSPNCLEYFLCPYSIICHLKFGLLPQPMKLCRCCMVEFISFWLICSPSNNVCILYRPYN